VRDRRRAKAVGTRPPAGCRGFPSQPGIAFQRARQAALRARTPRPSVPAGFGLPATPYRRSGTSLRSKPATYPRRPRNSRGRQDNPYRPVSFRSPVKQRGRRSCALAPAARHISKPYATVLGSISLSFFVIQVWRAATGSGASGGSPSTFLPRDTHQMAGRHLARPFGCTASQLGACLARGVLRSLGIHSQHPVLHWLFASSPTFHASEAPGPMDSGAVGKLRCGRIRSTRCCAASAPAAQRLRRFAMARCARSRGRGS
jgi:hypothetical protein